jgi:glycosyltransferase involved in cell wall biosynthesis
MKIGVNLAGSRPDGFGGGSVYSLRLIDGLLDAGHQLTVFLTSAVTLPNAPRGRTDVYLGQSAYSESSRIFHEMFSIGRLAREMKLDVLHTLGGYGVRMPRNSPPQVVTAYDCLERNFGQYFSFSRRLKRHYSFVAGDKYTAKYIAISEFTKTELEYWKRVQADRISVVPLGVDPRLKSDRLRFPYDSSAGIFEDAYIIYPASYAPHKNHAALFDALRIAQRELEVRIHLVLTGDGTDSQSILGEARNRGVGGSVSGLGWVPREDALRLIDHAKCLIFPSNYEGFGLPLIEAMATGTPVVASNTASIPEIVGEEALLFDPNNVDSIARAITDFFGRTHDDGVSRLDGKLRAGRYNWEATIRETVHVYESVI